MRESRITSANNHPGESTLYVVSYDIPDDRRRTRVHSALTGFGTWVQYSVFECFLDRKQRLLLEARLLKEIDQGKDTIRIYGLCGACQTKVEVLGRGETPHEDHIYML
jgi:CRISPR-associated protein Cas2